MSSIKCTNNIACSCGDEVCTEDNKRTYFWGKVGPEKTETEHLMSDSLLYEIAEIFTFLFIQMSDFFLPLYYIIFDIFHFHQFLKYFKI